MVMANFLACGGTEMGLLGDGEVLMKDLAGMLCRVSMGNLSWMLRRLSTEHHPWMLCWSSFF